MVSTLIGNILLLQIEVNISRAYCRKLYWQQTDFRIGGVPADTANYVEFLKELKAACGSKYGVTATLPSSYCTFKEWKSDPFTHEYQGIYKDLISFQWYSMWTGSTSLATIFTVS